MDKYEMREVVISDCFDCYNRVTSFWINEDGKLFVNSVYDDYEAVEYDDTEPITIEQMELFIKGLESLLSQQKARKVLERMK
jgi:hypothetical protein